MGQRVRRSASFLSFFFLALLCVPVVLAQTTQVTGQVLDANGVPYAGASMKAGLVFAGTPVSNPTVTINTLSQCKANGFGSAPCQVPFTPSNGPFNLDAQGNIPGGGITLQDNTQVTPSGTQWAFTVSTAGNPPPLGTGPQTCNATLTISGASQVVSSSFSTCPALGHGGAASIVNVVNPANSSYAGGAHGDGRICSTPTATVGSNIVTCADTGWNFNGTDASGRAWAKVGEIVFLSTATTDTSELTSILASPECVIQSIDSATQIHMGQVGNPSSACNATSNLTASGYLILGDLDTASSTQTQSALTDPFFAAWNAVITSCFAQFQMNPGVYLIERGEFNVSSTLACGNGPYIQNSRLGYDIHGYGWSTILVITPNFVATDCAPGCLFSANANMNLSDFALWGAGNSNPGSSFNNKSLALITGNTTNGGSNFLLRHVFFHGFGSQTTGLVGLNLCNNVTNACSDGIISDSIFESIGALVTYWQPGTSVAELSVTNSYFAGCGIGINNSFSANAGCVAAQAGRWVSHGGVYGFAPSTGVTAFVCTGTAECDHSGDTFPYVTSNTGAEYALTGGSETVRLDRSFISNPTAGGIGVVYATGTNALTVSETSIGAVTAALGLDCASGTCNLNNLGGNVFSGKTGTITGTASVGETGTVTCSASSATIIFKGTYLVNPVVVIQDQTTAGVVTQTSISTTQKVVGCPGASDVLNYTVLPNPF